LNPHGLPRQILSLFCLPIPALPQCPVAGGIISAAHGSVKVNDAAAIILWNFHRIIARGAWRDASISCMICGVTAPAAPAAKVLIVDDEPHNRDMIANFLELEGFHAVMAEDGEAALALVARENPDVILLDVMMPGPDGFEICRRLKSDPATVFTPVVILTALRGADERIKGAAAGADEFLSKPFDHIELITRVKSLVRVKRLNDELQSANRELERRVAQRTAELQQALTDLQEMDRLKSEFIANVSHELRTPVLHVKGYVDLLTTGALGELDFAQREGLDIAQTAIEQLERVVKDIVNFSDVHDPRLTLGPVVVAEVFAAVAQ
jgi:DNA-binding response OmpR family regulator